ncbi:MAG: MGMT family protein [Kiritimatiellae bacterium]|nr:MGMT family protein [Kiritimatiellia bacterium]MDD5522287.1 MGMT family protein [Kiritimatiellia bacterium]
MKKLKITDFQKRVYNAARRVPRGFITTYGILAREINCRSSLAVGQALKKNPFAPRVPCHRVISSDLSPGGFRGKREGVEIRRKKRLLGKEGVIFCDGKLVDPRRIYHF